MGIEGQPCFSQIDLILWNFVLAIRYILPPKKLKVAFVIWVIEVGELNWFLLKDTVQNGKKDYVTINLSFLTNY